MCDHPEAEDIAFVAVRLVEHRICEQNLGSGVTYGSAFAVVVSFDVFVGDECETEIDDFGLSVSGREDDVVGFYVSVDDVLLVAFFDDFEDIPEEFFCFLEVELFLLAEKVHQGLTRQIVEDDDETVLSFVKLSVVGHSVMIAQFMEDLSFGDGHFFGAHLFLICFIDKFGSDVFSRRFGLDFVHLD